MEDAIYILVLLTDLSTIIRGQITLYNKIRRMNTKLPGNTNITKFPNLYLTLKTTLENIAVHLATILTRFSLYVISSYIKINL